MAFLWVKTCWSFSFLRGCSTITQTWQVSLMTTYLASLDSNMSLSLKQLSWKLAMLFSLTCPERVSALTKLDLPHCHILPEGLELMLSSSHKRGTADQLPKAFFAPFPSNSKLCPVETLRCYLTHGLLELFVKSAFFGHFGDF